MTNERPELTEAEAEYERAASALRREEVLKKLASRPGLSYARITDDSRGPYLAAWEGRLIGEVWSDTTSAIGSWYASPGENRTSPSGPFNTIRLAAASLPR